MQLLSITLKGLQLGLPLNSDRNVFVKYLLDEF